MPDVPAPDLCPPRRLPDEVRNRYDLSSLQIVFHMAAPMPPWLGAGTNPCIMPAML